MVGVGLSLEVFMVEKRKCSKGVSCASACIAKNKKCRVELSSEVGSHLGKLQKKLQSASNQNEEKQGKDPYDGWTVIAQGFHGKIAINSEGTRAVKILRKDRPDGKEGKFGEYEVELATKMGELGHSPKIYSSSDSHIEMDVARGAPLWRNYHRGDDEPVMNAPQARAAGYALRDLHRMGFAHRDAHSQQFLVDGDNVKLVDFGLSRPLSERTVFALQDLAKSNPLIRFDNPELANDPYFRLVNKYLTPYRELGRSTSKASQARRQELSEGYIRELQELKI